MSDERRTGSGRRTDDERGVELQALFDLQWRRMTEATTLWRAAHPGYEDVLPDLGELLAWFGTGHALVERWRVSALNGDLSSLGALVDESTTWLTNVRRSDARQTIDATRAEVLVDLRRAIIGIEQLGLQDDPRVVAAAHDAEQALAAARLLHSPGLPYRVSVEPSTSEGAE